MPLWDLLLPSWTYMFRCNGSKLSQPASQPANQSARRTNGPTDRRTRVKSTTPSARVSRQHRFLDSQPSDGERGTVLPSSRQSLKSWPSCIVKRGILDEVVTRYSHRTKPDQFGPLSFERGEPRFRGYALPDFRGSFISGRVYR